jgi:hypothetical protein
LDALANLDDVAAHLGLGIATADDLVAAANLALDRGFAPAGLIAIFDRSQPVLADVRPLFEDALRELGRPAPSVEEAVWRVIRQQMRRIAGREVPPREPVTWLRRHMERWLKSNHCMWDSHGLERIIGAYWAFDDLLERPEVSYEGLHGAAAVKALEDEMVRLAQEWLAKHAA